MLPVPASFSEASSGIWTLSLGRLPPVAPPRPEFVREGGPNVAVGAEEAAELEDIEIFLFVGFGGLFIAFPALFAAAEDSAVTVVIELAELLRCGSEGRVASEVVVEEAQCCDRMERDSSMGVKILRDLTGMRFTGSSICACGAVC